MLGGDPKSPCISQKRPDRETEKEIKPAIKLQAKYGKYMAESTNRYKEYLAWLKTSRIKAAKAQKEYESAIKVLADEAAGRHRRYLAEGAKRQKKLKEMIIDD